MCDLLLLVTEYILLYSLLLIPVSCAFIFSQFIFIYLFPFLFPGNPHLPACCTPPLLRVHTWPRQRRRRTRRCPPRPACPYVCVRLPGQSSPSLGRSVCMNAVMGPWRGHPPPPRWLTDPTDSRPPPPGQAGGQAVSIGCWLGETSCRYCTVLRYLVYCTYHRYPTQATPPSQAKPTRVTHAAAISILLGAGGQPVRKVLWILPPPHVRRRPTAGGPRWQMAYGHRGTLYGYFEPSPRERRCRTGFPFTLQPASSPFS